MKTSITQLILEVTRRCNMCCEHYLRGDAEAVDMNKEVVNKVLDEVCHIGHIFFTGGEPSLNIPLIQYVFDELIRRKISIGSFGIITNGKENQEELAITLLKAYSRLPLEDPKYCYVAMSKNQFHEETGPNLLKALSFYSDNHKHIDQPERSLISMGRGKAFSEAREKNFTDIYIECDKNATMVEKVCITALGDVLSDCDISYELQESYSVGNVLDEKLTDMFLKMAECRGCIA